MNLPAKPDFLAMMACRRFRRCNVPICPLDPWQDKRVYVKGERKCTLPKAERMQLGKLVSEEQLPMRGMTKREWAGHLGGLAKAKKIAQGAIC